MKSTYSEIENFLIKQGLGPEVANERGLWNAMRANFINDYGFAVT